MKISIVVLNYNGLENTLECLDSLKKCDLDNLNVRIIVVDNNSQDGSTEALRQIKDIDLVENQANFGFAGGNNIGIERAFQQNADAVLILNNDTIVDKFLFVNPQMSLSQ